MGFEVLAAIDLLDGRVVRLRRGAFEAVTTFGDDPTAIATAFVDAGIRWLHVVDLDGAREGRLVHGSAIAAIVSAVAGRASIEVGGGIRQALAATQLIDQGVDRVVLGTAALADPALVAELVGRLGPDRVAAAVDVRDGLAVGDAWRAGAAGAEPAAVVRRLAEAGVGVFEVTAVERDGTLEGPDLDRLREMVALGAGAVIAAGGIRSSLDVEAVRAVGCAGSIVGRALYEGRIDPRRLVAQVAGPAPLDAGSPIG